MRPTDHTTGADNPTQQGETMHQPQTLRPATSDCPDPASVTIDADTLAELSELCGTLQEFLRCNGVAELLGDFYATSRRDPFPNHAANLLIDQVGFTALTLRHRLPPHQGGGHR